VTDLQPLCRKLKGYERACVLKAVDPIIAVFSVAAPAQRRTGLQESLMYIARFSYSVLPVNRQRAMEFIRREVDAAKAKQLAARLLVPLTRGPGGAALQFEIELPNLDQFDRFRERGIESEGETHDWMQEFSEILLSPPEVELLRVD
jgi:hypothetical protein